MRLRERPNEELFVQRVQRRARKNDRAAQNVSEMLPWTTYTRLFPVVIDEPVTAVDRLVEAREWAEHGGVA